MFLLRVQSCIRRFSFRIVARDDLDRGFPFVAEGAHPRLDFDRRTIETNETAFGPRWLRSGGDLPGTAGYRGAFIRMDDFRRVATDKLVGRLRSQQSQGRGINKGDLVFANNDHGIGRMIDQKAIARFALSQRLFRQLVFDDLSPENLFVFS